MELVSDLKNETELAPAFIEFSISLGILSFSGRAAKTSIFKAGTVSCSSFGRESAVSLLFGINSFCFSVLSAVFIVVFISAPPFFKRRKLLIFEPSGSPNLQAPDL